MKLPKVWPGCFLAAIFMIPLHQEAAPAAPTAPAYELSLRDGGVRRLGREGVGRLYQKAIEVVESSNFNSRVPLWEWKTAEILEGYRATVAGRYCVITFKAPQRIKTIGGEIGVREIVVGLTGTDYPSSLYTIDEELRIVGHAKYSGSLCVELVQLVKQVEVENK